MKNPEINKINIRYMPRQPAWLSWLAKKFPKLSVALFNSASTNMTTKRVFDPKGDARTKNFRFEKYDSFDAWRAARDPTSAYREVGGLAPFGLFFGGLGLHTMIYGTTGSGKSSTLSQLLGNLMFCEKQKKALCFLDETKGWEICADEALDAKHPAVALAWMTRAKNAEASRNPELIEAFALSLARSMAGMQSDDGLHPDYAMGAQQSPWAERNIQTILGKAAPISIALAESREISDFISCPLQSTDSKAKCKARI